MLLQILIPYTVERKDMFNNLKDKLLWQIERRNLFNQIEILSLEDNYEMTIGEKRNKLLDMVTADYCCFFDSDDLPSDCYIDTLVLGIRQNVDCISLKGIITFDGKDPAIFEHSLKYKEYKTNENAVYPEVKYERYPNHISCMKSSIAKQFRFPEINHGEDTDFATQIFNSGLLKTEFYHNEILYHYLFKTNK